MEPSKIDTAKISTAIAQEPLLVDYPETTRQAFVKLVQLLVKGQARMNLTAIKEPRKMVRYHLADSVALERAVAKFPVSGEIRNAADVGTGGGFPLLPMAVLWPHVQWVGIESVGKKAKFVSESAEALELTNVEAWAARAEDVGRSEDRDSFDIVTSRAVGPVASLLEVNIPLLRVGGRLYLFKTEAAAEEWQACRELLHELGGTEIGEYKYRLEGDEQSRVIFVAEKVSETPDAYPRAAGIPFKKPLVKWPMEGRKQ